MAASSEISVEEIMRRIREEVRRRKEALVRGEEVSFVPSTAAPSVPSASELDLHRSAYRLEELLAHHDREFVINAYRAILKREPDPEGLEHYLSALRAGRMSKIEILGRLRFSPEGRRLGVKIKGLTLPFVCHLSFHLPVIGYLGRLVTGVLNLPRFFKNFERFETFTQAQHQEQEVRVQQELIQLRGALEETRQQLTQLREELRQQMTRKIEKAECDSRLSSLRAQLEEVRWQGGDLAKQLDQLAGEVERMKSRLGQKVDQGQHAALFSEIEALRQEWRQLEGRLKLEDKFLGLFRDFLMEVSSLKQSLGEHLSRVEREQIQQTLEPFLKELATLKEMLNERKIEAFEKRWSQLEQELAALKNHLAEMASLEEISALNHQLEALEHQRSLFQKRLAGVERQLLLFLDGLRRWGGPTEELVSMGLKEDPHLLDSLYFALEDRFRGNREEIKERLKVYLPYVQETLEKVGGGVVLDLGCGRGEWLELLGENGIEAIGVDTNRLMIDQCRELGLEVIEAEAVEYLRQQPSDTLAVITGFHLVEHLPLRQMVALFDEGLRVLKPGGMVIFETPNPENLLVGACYFYLDPTHRNPIPRQLLHFLLEDRGFAGLKTLEGQPFPEGETPSLEHYLRAPRDYAILGYKP